MSHFAQLDSDNIVLNVIVAEQEFVDSLPDASSWVQTSYNTYGGVHSDNGTPLRKNYAAIGFIYDEARDAFIPPQPYPSWTLNERTCLWEAPVAYPDDGLIYRWDELKTIWVLIDE